MNALFRKLTAKKVSPTDTKIITLEYLQKLLTLEALLNLH